MPVLTATQYVVLFALASGMQCGPDLRTALLAAGGSNRSYPAFHQLTARLERDGYVRRRPLSTDRRVWFALTREGRKALQTTREFYVSRSL